MAGTEQKPKLLGAGAAALLIIVGGTFIVYQMFGARTSGAGPVPKSAFYTDDNGKSFFRDDIDKASPFDHGGKQAFRCDVFEGANGKQFVGLVYRFTDSGRREFEAYLPTRSKDTDGSTRRGIEERGTRVKAVADPESAWAINDEVTRSHLQNAVKDSAGKPATLVNP